ncbi:MAG TPA: copper resistance system multicopper oxidase [Gammaproteobacteria bacterium]|nr:copper resistance system multicopper oxidase [Gammaproteobacteria bacterium]
MKIRRNGSVHAESISLPRRRFVQGLAAGGALAGLGLLSTPVMAGAARGARPRELSGTEFDLVIGETPVNFTGRPRMATTVNGQLPAPLLRWREGDTVTLRVTNRLAVPTSIHWHGIILPNGMDGVPGLTYAGIMPGETFVYRFKVGQSGTYWYHSHSGFQEQTGIYGSIVIEPRGQDPVGYDREHVVLLSDWTDQDPDTVFAKLKQMDGYYNYSKLTLGDFIQRARRDGFRNAVAYRAMWDRMRMSPRDLADVSGATYTYLTNGSTPAGNWTGLFGRGERVRLRFINGSAMSYFDVRIPGLKMTVVAADGQNVHPVTVDEFRIGVAETYDVVVQPHDDRAYTVFAQSVDRSGYARGTLAPRAGMQAPIPAMDPVPTLTMSDAGMSMAGMSGMDMAGMKMGDAAMGGANASGAAASNHPAMGHGSDAMGTMSGPAGGHGAMGHAMGGMDGMASAAKSGGGMMEVKHHPATEYGPGTAMHASVVSTRLDDPGVGLRSNGRRVLTYADLHSLDGWLDPRDPGRTIELHLTGNMERYMWSFDGVKFSDAGPLRFKHGERLRIRLVNDTMMEHPIHLHGLWSEVESPDGDFQARKHTVSVKPGHTVSYRVLADARGRWAYHCHLLYHMKAGMFREVEVL